MDQEWLSAPIDIDAYRWILRVGRQLQPAARRRRIGGVRPAASSVQPEAVADEADARLEEHAGDAMMAALVAVAVVVGRTVGDRGACRQSSRKAAPGLGGWAC